jgi:hypothetical protein
VSINSISFNNIVLRHLLIMIRDIYIKHVIRNTLSFEQKMSCVLGSRTFLPSLPSACFTERPTFRKPLLTNPLLSDLNQKYIKSREHGVRWHTLIIWITNTCWWIVDRGNNKSCGYQCNFICQDCTEAFTNYDQKHMHEMHD